MEWSAYLHFNANPKGASREIWLDMTCMKIFAMTRDTRRTLSSAANPCRGLRRERMSASGWWLGHRGRPLAFTFDGKPYLGVGGTASRPRCSRTRPDVGRSFKYHRPRGSGVDRRAET